MEDLDESGRGLKVGRGFEARGYRHPLARWNPREPARVYPRSVLPFRQFSRSAPSVCVCARALWL